MDTRREFLKKSMLLSAAAGLSNAVPASIQKALMINPEPGSSYLDAEHVVILMQENRSFDHCFGTLKGVRGFNDPRAITLPNKNLVWLQTDIHGDTYAPFRFDIHDTKITWITDNAYKNKPVFKKIQSEETIVLNLHSSYGWYDFSVAGKGHPHFSKRFAGKVETGKETFTDPLMGKAIS